MFQGGKQTRNNKQNNLYKACCGNLSFPGKRKMEVLLLKSNLDAANFFPVMGGIS